MECKEVWSCTQVTGGDAARDSALSSNQLIKQFTTCSFSTELPRFHGKKKSARAEEDRRDESGRGREGERLEGGPRSTRSKIGRYTNQHISINEFSGYRGYFRFSYRRSTYDSNPRLSQYPV